MPLGVAQEVLAEHGICGFRDDARQALNAYLQLFRSADEFERSLRENLVASAGAELACFRVAGFGALPANERVLVSQQDVAFAIEVADTASTVECYTIRAASERNIRMTDLFLWTGDAAKAQVLIGAPPATWRNMRPAQLAAALAGGFETLSTRWQELSGRLVYTQAARHRTVYFACLRMCTLLDLSLKDTFGEMNVAREGLRLY